jgi:hypothetical protein
MVCIRQFYATCGQAQRLAMKRRLAERRVGTSFTEMKTILSVHKPVATGHQLDETEKLVQVKLCTPLSATISGPNCT